MPEKNICLVLPSLGTGGAEKVGINLANYFAFRGLDVDLVTFQNESGLKNLVSHNVNLIDLNMKRARYGIFALHRYLKISKPKKVISVLRRTNIYLALACFLLKDPPELFFREASPLRDLAIEGHFNHIAYLILMKLCYWKAKSIIANSSLTKQDLIDFGIPKAMESVVIPNPVLPLNLEVLLLEEVGHPWFTNKCLKVILNVGRLYPEKDQAILIKAFHFVSEKCPEARLLILGEGPEKPKLERLIVDLDLSGKVILHPFVDNPFPYYRQSTIFALTSLWEGFGNVIVEALSTGTPVICTDCPGGPRAILKDGKYGRLVPPRNPQAIAEAIIAALDNSGERKELLIDRAKDFTVAKIGDRYAEVMGLDLNKVDPEKRTRE